MKTLKKTSITIEATVNASVEKVWKLWTDTGHITQWNCASDDWHSPKAKHDLKPGGKFVFRMEAKDGSMGFDFEGVYDEVKINERLAYTLGDGRKVNILFKGKGKETKVVETFEAEETNSVELQRSGWQAILDNFKKYTENYDKLEKLHFEITIHASANKVFKTMLDKKQYVLWTSEFNPTSYFEGSWEKGSKILFLGTSQDGEPGGMVSRIKENIPGKFVSIEHLGIVENGKEITSGPKVESWAGLLENYSFAEKNGNTLLSIDIDSNSEFKKYFEETWPKALKKLKDICES